MLTATYEKEICERLSRLDSTGQERVLEFVRTLTQSLPQGEPGSQLIKWGGWIPAEDLEEMEAAIEDGCERVNPNGW